MNNTVPERFFEKFPHVVAAASHRQDGDMKVTYDMNGKEAAKNRKDFVKSLFPDSGDGKAVVTDINHGTKIQFIQSTSSPVIKDVDSLMTKGKYDLPLAVTFADCPPVYFYDPVADIIAVAHCSWHNVSKKFPRQVIKKMIKKGSKRKNIRAAIGPGICVKCYDFGLNEALKYFREYPSFIHRISDNKEKCKLDLKGIIESLLRSDRIGHIEISPDCTCCNRNVYFSARGEKMKTDNIKAGLAVIGIRKIRNHPA